MLISCPATKPSMLMPTVLHFDVSVRLFRTAAEANSHVALFWSMTMYAHVPPGRQTLLHDEFHWDTFDHPTYSPDLAPSDFHLFLKMKEHLAGKRHADDEDLQHAVVDWLNSHMRTYSMLSWTGRRAI